MIVDDASASVHDKLDEAKPVPSLPDGVLQEIERCRFHKSEIRRSHANWEYAAMTPPGALLPKVLKGLPCKTWLRSKRRLARG